MRIFGGEDAHDADGIIGAETPLPSTPPQRRDENELLRAGAVVVGRLARSGPLVIAIEGLGRLNAESFDILMLWVRQIINYPVLIVLPHADEVAPVPDRVAAGIDHLIKDCDGFVLALAPMAAESVIELCKELRHKLSLGRVSAAELDWISKTSDGNPGIAIRLLLQESGKIRRGDTAFRLPAELRDEILARAQSLSVEARHVLLLAALAGSDVRWTVLGKASGLQLAAFTDALDRLGEAGFLINDETVVRFCRGARPAGIRRKPFAATALAAACQPLAGL